MSNRDDAWKRLPHSGIRYKKIGDIYLVSDSKIDTYAQVILKEQFEKITSVAHTRSKHSSAIKIGYIPLVLVLLGDLIFDYPDMLSYSMVSIVVGLCGFMMAYSLIYERGDTLKMLRSYDGNSFDLVEYDRVMDAFPEDVIEIDQAISDYWVHGSMEAKAFYQEKIDFVNQLDDARRSAIDDKWNRRTLEP